MHWGDDDVSRYQRWILTGTLAGVVNFCVLIEHTEAPMMRADT